MKRTLFAFLCMALALPGCLDVKPKNLGSSLVNFGDDNENDTTTPETFRFNFAYINTAATAPLNRIVYLQGAPNTKSTIVATCNLSATNCVCEFMDASENILDTSDYSEMSYDNVGNYVRCKYDGTLASLAKVRVRNQNSTKYSDVYTLDTPASLTLQKLVGDGQDVNKVRTISRYTCLYNFLQKAGTTELLFDCSNQGSQCWNSGGASGDFCLLQSSFPFHLYTSNYDNNHDQKIADKLYFSEGDGKVCGLQIKQYDCGGNNGTPVKSFGLMGEQTGVFQVPVSLTPGPGLTITSYGFAAAIGTYNGTTVCPPGMVRKIFYRAATTNAAAIGPSHNYPSTLIATEIRTPGDAPTSLEVNKIGGGDCTGTGTAPCTMPGFGAGRVTTFPYTNTGETEFCVIDPALLL